MSVLTTLVKIEKHVTTVSTGVVILLITLGMLLLLIDLTLYIHMCYIKRDLNKLDKVYIS